MNAQLTPARILETATAFWPSKVLLSAIELGVFTELASGPRTGAQLARAVGILPGRAADFFDALLSMGFLNREGTGESATYSNTEETALFLDRQKPTYAGGMPEMLNARLFGFWNGLTDALRTGQAQSETKTGGAPLFEVIYADPLQTEAFLAAMGGLQMGNFMALARTFDFGEYRRVCDVGGARGDLCRVLAEHYPHLALTSFDLPPVCSVARRHLEAWGVGGRVELAAGDFLRDPLPEADVLIMGNILHDWDEAGKRQLIDKAYAALPAGGALIAVENVIDDERRRNAFGLLMSLNMLIELGADGGFDYTGAQFDGWCRTAGFTRTEVKPLVGPTSAAIAYK